MFANTCLCILSWASRTRWYPLGCFMLWPPPPPPLCVLYHLNNVWCRVCNWPSSSFWKFFVFCYFFSQIKTFFSILSLFAEQKKKGVIKNFMFEFPCIITLYYIKNQQDATLAVLFISHYKITLHVSDAFCVSKDVRGRLPLHYSAVATDLGHPYWIYIIPTHGMHQWLLLQFLVLLMMDAGSVWKV